MLWISSQFIPSSRGERGLRMLKPNHVLDFQPILSILTVGEGIEDTEPQPFWGFQPICPLSPRERVRERAVSRRLTFRFLGFAKNLLKVRSNRRSHILRPLRQICLDVRETKGRLKTKILFSDDLFTSLTTLPDALYLSDCAHTFCR